MSARDAKISRQSMLERAGPLATAPHGAPRHWESHVLADDLHPETRLVPFRVLGNTDTGPREHAPGRPQEGSDIEHGRAGPPRQLGVEDALTTGDLLRQECPSLLLSSLRPLGPSKRRVLIELIEAQLGAHLVNGALTVRRHFRRHLAVSRKELPSNGAEAVHGTVRAFFDLRSDRGALDGRSAAAEERSRFPFTRPTARSELLERTNRGVQGNRGESRALVNHVDESLEHPRLLGCKCRAMQLGDSNEPPRRTGLYARD